MSWIYKLTGGRPMTFIVYAFSDCVSGEKVNYYTDKLDQPWLATSRWALFRVKPEHGPTIWAGETP